MARRQGFDPSGLIGAPIDPGALLGLRQRLVGDVLPQRPHPIAGALVGQLGDPLAGDAVPIAHHQVHMRIVLVLARLMNGGTPGRPALGQPFGKGRHQGPAFVRSELPGQGDRQLVDDPGVLAIGLLFPVQPGTGGTAISGHALAEQIRLGIGPGDVANMRPRRPFRVGGLADAAEVEAVDRDASLLTTTAGPPPGRAAHRSAPTGQAVPAAAARSGAWPW